MARLAEQGTAGRGANLHLLPASCRFAPYAASFDFRIDNYRQIQQAYGQDVARKARSRLCHILEGALRDDGRVTTGPDATLNVQVRDRKLLGAGLLDQACGRWAQSVCRAVAMVPIATAQGPLHLALSGAWSFPEIVGDHVARNAAVAGRGAWLEHQWLPEDVPADASGWAERYRADMAVVASVLAAIELDHINGRHAAGTGDIALAWQPVRDALEPSCTLYHEALLRMTDRQGGSHSPAPIILALERLGFARVLDHHLVSSVITELEQDFSVTLAVNISAQSAVSNGWWRDVEDRLRANPSVARRLVLEITETAALPDLAGAADFASHMRGLGCRIALDDLGTGFASIRHLLALAPDIVKIDRFFLERAGQSDQSRATFMHLVGLAQSLVPTVIVEGVENDSEAQLALDAGARWQQGYLWGRPTSLRIWRISATEETLLPGESDL